MPASFRAIYDAVNVKAKGAVGDGVADDRAAIQAAIAAAATSSRSVFFPAGDYKVSQVASDGYCLWLPNFVNLFGVGAQSRIQNSHATASTIRARDAATSLSGYSRFWSIRDLHFNPAVGVSRNDSAAEIEYGSSGSQGVIENCSFGERQEMSGAAMTADETSRVGTCIVAGNSSTATQVLKIRNCRGFGYFRFLLAVKIVDVFVSECFADADRSNAQSILLDDGTEAAVFVNNDFVNSQGLTTESGSSDACLKILAGARFCAFTNCYFDTHKYGLQASGGESHNFDNCWFAPLKATSGTPIGALISGGSGFRFSSCRFVGGARGIEWSGGANNSAEGCLMACHTGNEGVLIGTGTRDWLLRSLWIDNDAFPGRVTAGSMAAGITVTGGGLAGRSRDCRFRTGGSTSWLADVVV